MRRFLSSLPLGVRWILCLLTTCYLAEFLLHALANFDLSDWLALSSPAFWHGRLWQILTYILLPASFMDFAMNTIAFAMLAPRLEQAWSRGELCSFCLISAVGAGLAKIAFLPHSALPLAGLSSVTFGLLAAWLKLFGREEVLAFGLWKMTVRQMILAILAVIVLSTLLQGGLNAMGLLIPLCGGLVAWIYLVVRWHRNSSRSAHAAASHRISRLEL